MGKKKNSGSNVVQAVPIDASSDAATAGDNTTQEPDTPPEDAEDVDELELLQVELGDMVKVKQVLDEAVAGYILDYLPENYAWDNWKLLIMFIACCFAMVAQFAPIPFPESRPVLGICGSAYFILSGILQLIATFIDQDAILFTVPMTEKHISDCEKKFINKDLQKYGIVVRTSLPRFSEWFTVTIEFFIKDNLNPPPCVTEKWSIGQFFDKEGYFDEIGLTNEIEKLLNRFDQGKYDTPDDKKKTD